MSEAIRDGKFVELTYKVTDRKSGHVLTRVEFPLGYVHAVPYTHLTLPTSDLVKISVVAGTLKKKQTKKHVKH